MALMECVRGERPGVFNNRLYDRTFEALVTRAGAAPEVLGLLIGRFLGGWVQGRRCIWGEEGCRSVLERTHVH